MGTVSTIDAVNFPKQGQWLNCRMKVCFHYDTTKTVGGVCIRDDMEKPFETIIKLDDGRVVRGVECQFQPED